MRYPDLLRRAWKNLWHNCFRTIMTTVAISIGTAALVLVVSMAFGVQEIVQNEVRNTTNLKKINITAIKENKDNFRLLSKEDVNELVKIKHIQDIIFQGELNARSEINYENHVIIGTQAIVVEPEGFKHPPLNSFLEGSPIKDADGAVVNNYLNERISENLKLGNKPLNFVGETLSLQIAYRYVNSKGEAKEKIVEIPFRIDGIIQDQQPVSEIESDNTNIIYIPLERVKEVSTKLNVDQSSLLKIEGTQVFVMVDNVNNVEKVLNTLKENNYTTSSNFDILQRVQYISFVIQLVVGGFGTIILLVSTVGIGNTMLMSTSERTEEIGIMKSLGGRLSSIRKLFLFESAYIGFLGGGFGIFLGYILSSLANVYFRIKIGAEFHNSQQISIVPIYLPPLVLAFALSISLTAGIIPAIKAVKTDILSTIKR